MPIAKAWRVTIVIDSHKRAAIFDAFGDDLIGMEVDKVASSGLNDPLGAFTLIVKADPMNVVDRDTCEAYVENRLKGLDGVVAISRITAL